MQKIFRVVLLFLILFSMIAEAQAYVCRNKITQKLLRNGSDTVTVPLNQSITPGETVIFDMGNYYECRNEIPRRFIDYMYILANGVSTALGEGFQVSAYINSVKYLLPITYQRVFELKDGNWYDLSIKVTYYVSETPGKMIRILAGENIATLKLTKYSVPAETQQDFQWSIVAANDSVLTSGTCYINEGKPMQVDFGTIQRWTLENDPDRSMFNQSLHVPYRCKNPVSMPVNLTLSARKAAFSDQSIATSNENLGVQMYYEGNLVKPGDSVRAELRRGYGQSDFNFRLVTNPKTKIELGEFKGHAYLIMSAY